MSPHSHDEGETTDCSPLRKMEPTKRITFVVLLLVSITFVFSFLLIKDSKLIVDETDHYDQIKRFINKDFTLNPELTTIPGYHVIFAFFASMFSLASIPSIRFLCLIFSMLSVVTFFLLARTIHKDSSVIRTLHYCFFPILFPFFFLIYTDVFSLWLILISLYALVQQRYYIAGIIGTLSLLVRQNNVVWVLFLCMFNYLEGYGYRLNIEMLKRWIGKCSFFLIGLMMFGIFLILNKGVAIGAGMMHPSFSFHLGNIYFMLFLFFFLFLPLNISNFPKISLLLKKNRRIIIWIVCTFLIYMFTFVVDHPFNLQWADYFLRNRVLLFFSSTVLLKILFFIPIVYSLLSIVVTKLQNKSLYLIYPVSFLYLIPSWLIEQRYYLIPFALFILFREEKSKLVEHLSLVMYLTASAVLFYGIRIGIFFL
jgi:alpha-1,2-glucosyltransferase